MAMSLPVEHSLALLSTLDPGLALGKPTGAENHMSIPHTPQTYSRERDSGWPIRISSSSETVFTPRACDLSVANQLFSRTAVAVQTRVSLSLSFWDSVH